MRPSLGKWFPGVEVLTRYERAWWHGDLLAGVVLTALLIPAGIGYARVAGLPAVTGLYATIAALVAYAVFGPSRILVLGTQSSLAPIVGASILPLAAGDSDRAVALAGLLALMMGGFLIAAAFFRLGFLTDLLSKPIRIGFLNGVALVVIVGQLPALLGFTVDADWLGGEIGATLRAIGDGLVDPATAAIGLGSIAVIAAIRLVPRRLPGVLFALVGSIVVVEVLGWSDDVEMVGALPRGVPTPALGGLALADVWALAGPALGISLVAFAETGMLSRVFAARRGVSVDGTEEMRALGISNLASGLFGGFAVSASMTRTPVAERSGAHTQLTGVAAAGLMLAFLLLVPNLTGYLPTAAIAAVVIVPTAALIDVSGVAHLARVSRVDCALSISALAGVAFIGVLEGIVFALLLSVVAFVNQAWRPYRVELGRLPGVRGYHDLSRNPNGHRVDSIAIVRFDAPLFFANAGIFGSFVRSIAEAEPAPRYVVLAAEPITSIDSTAVDEFVALDDHLARAGIAFVIAEMKGPVRDELERYGLLERFGPERFAPTVGAAVDMILGYERDDIGRPSDRT